MEKKQTIFVEEQNFRQWWLWVLLIVTAAPTFGVLVFQLYTGEQIGDRPASNFALLLITLLVPVPIFLSIYFAKLTTIISSTGIEYGWNMPTSDLNFLSWDQIQSIEVIEYKFIGYGFRISKDYGIVYNTSGNKGLHITRTNGRQILIGTKKHHALISFLKRIDAPKLLETS